MYMDYTKLWKLLIDKNMTKTDLMQITGLSSRIIAKLSKNENINTDTLSKICKALNCDVSDIMECKEKRKMLLYNFYKKLGVVVEKEENYKIIKFQFEGLNYVIYRVNKTMNKSMIVNCKADGTIYIEQFYPFGGIMRPSSIEKPLVKPIKNRDETVIVVFPGKPCFTGVDDGIFVTSKNDNITDSSIYVMSEATFKQF